MAIGDNILTSQSEQHIKLRDWRIGRDNKDSSNILEWLQNLIPFSK